jgi:hypothetical protein
MADKERGSWIDRAQAQVAELTPEVGFNVVAVDDYKMAGDEDALYLVGHYTDEAEAKKVAAEHEKETGDTTHVYGPWKNRK